MSTWTVPLPIHPRGGQKPNSAPSNSVTLNGIGPGCAFSASRSHGAVNDLLEAGPPERGPELLMRPSSRTAVKDELNMMIDSRFSPHANSGPALNRRPQLILTRRGRGNVSDPFSARAGSFISRVSDPRRNASPQDHRPSRRVRSQVPHRCGHRGLAGCGRALSQLALSWVLCDQRVSSALISASSVAQLEEIVAALREEELAVVELHAVDGTAR